MIHDKIRREAEQRFRRNEMKRAAQRKRKGSGSRQPRANINSGLEPVGRNPRKIFLKFARIFLARRNEATGR